MSTVTETPGANAEATSTAPLTQQRRNVFELRDLVLPVLIGVVMGVLLLWLRSQDLDTIEQNLLEPSGIISATWEHVYVSFVIAALVLLLAVPLGVVVTREKTRRLAPLVLGIANFGQAAPVLGLLALAGIFFVGFWAVVLIITGYTALAVLRNTIAGLQQVDKGALDAAKGMGMSPFAVLMRVELPLAVPIIGAGARTALILAVATVPLGYTIGAGGLGQALFGAIKTNRAVPLLTIAVTIAVLALLLDWVAGILQRLATPRGIR